MAALLVLAVVLQLARLGWSSSLNSLWAEDGPIYMQEALLNGTWDAIGATYATYLVVVPRLIAEVASLAPLQDVPAAVSILSAAVVGLSGLVVWHASAAHLRNPYLRGILAVLTVLTPVAGLESIDSAAYVPWYMLFASFWILLWRPATWRGTLAGAAFILLTGLSTPGLWFFAPLALLRGLAVRDRTDFAILGAYAAGALAQVPVLLGTDETAVTPVWTSDIWTVFLQRIVDGAPLGLRLGGNAWVHLGWPLLIALLLAGAVGFAVGFRRAGAGARWIAAVALPTALVMFVVSLYQRAVGTPMLWPEGFYQGAGSRYAIVPALLVVSAALVLIDSRERGREPAAGWRRWATPASAAVAGPRDRRPHLLLGARAERPRRPALGRCARRGGPGMRQDRRRIGPGPDLSPRLRDPGLLHRAGPLRAAALAAQDGRAPSQRRARARSPSRRSRRRSRSSAGSQRRAESLPPRVARSRRCAAARASAPSSTAATRGAAATGMNLTWVASRLRATRRAFSAPGRAKPASQEALPTCQTTASGT